MANGRRMDLVTCGGHHIVELQTLASDSGAAIGDKEPAR
jgi:hypothetical protein